MPDRDLGPVHAVDDEGTVDSDLAGLLRHGQVHGLVGRDVRILEVPAAAVAQVNEPGAGVTVLVLVPQDYGPAVALLGCRRGGVKDDGGAAEGWNGRHARSLFPSGS